MTYGKNPEALAIRYPCSDFGPIKDTEMLTRFWTGCVILKYKGGKTIQQICDIIKPHIK